MIRIRPLTAVALTLDAGIAVCAVWALVRTTLCRHACPPEPPRDESFEPTAARPPILNDWWGKPALFIDPLGGSDSNSCTSSGSPCKTYKEIQYGRWQCFGDPRGCPRLGTGGSAVNQVIHYKPPAAGVDAGPTVTTDPVHYNPSLENGSTGVIVCDTIGTVATTGTIGTVTARVLTPGSAALENIVLPAAPVEGYVNASGGYPTSAPFAQLVVDTTNSSSWWVYRLVSGTTFQLSMPTVPLSPPFASGTLPTAVTPVSGDSVTVYDPCPAEIVQTEPVLVDWDAAQLASVTVQHMRSTSAVQPTALGNAANEWRVGSYVNLIDCASDRTLFKETTGGRATDLISNVFAFNFIGSATGSNGNYNENLTNLVADVFFEGNSWSSAPNSDALVVDGDTIFRDTRMSGGIQLLDAYVDSAGVWQMAGSVTFTTSHYFTSSLSALWAAPATPYSLDVTSGGHLAITTQTVAHHFVNPTIQSEGQSVGCNGTGAVLVTTCNLPLSPTQIDDAGALWVPGGGSIGKFGPTP